MPNFVNFGRSSNRVPQTHFIAAKHSFFIIRPCFLWEETEIGLTKPNRSCRSRKMCNEILRQCQCGRTIGTLKYDRCSEAKSQGANSICTKKKEISKRV